MTNKMTPKITKMQKKKATKEDFTDSYQEKKSQIQ